MESLSYKGSTVVRAFEPKTNSFVRINHIYFFSDDKGMFYWKEMKGQRLSGFNVLEVGARQIDNLIGRHVGFGKDGTYVPSF